ncbi:GP46-like surface antigen, putative [Bodo saltans]|uniref:GP46-like surface antigen, putative n=1 Tax=Bodo saltans TaxID=75058 RepID=A0A0S4ILX2_BODSA|nr:GP46-like surface antigen, putative [Bodo saltans]|eukprot:CUE72232.1 GP46-like surface antigen, putative [Bodo saltans]
MQDRRYDCRWLAVTLFMLVSLSSAKVTQGEVDLVSEFFVATKFANETPCTIDTVCVNWPQTINCSDLGIVVLNFTSKSLTGTLPSSLGSLPHLAAFMMQGNSLTGTLPPEYAAWNATLTGFFVGDNKLNGTLPPEYGAWKFLTGFTVFLNNLTGTLPPEYSALTRLGMFDASHNSLTSTLPNEYSRLTGIHDMFLCYNQLNGTLPKSYGAIINMYNFQVNSNQLTGTFPPEYSAWSSLSVFVADTNNFTGTLPPEYANWTLVNSFYCHQNQLTGSLPAEYSSWTSMVRFLARDNQLTGVLPSSYSLWSKTDTFNVNNNMLSGTLPPIYLLWGTSVSAIAIASNRFTGSIPVSWGQAMTALMQLTVSNNSLSGALSSLLLFPSIKLLTLSANYFSGSLPPGVWNAIQVLDAQNNTDLVGSFSYPSLFAASVCGTSLCKSSSTSATVLTCFPPSVQADLTNLAGTEGLLLLVKYQVVLSACQQSTLAPAATNTTSAPRSGSTVGVPQVIEGTSTAVTYVSLFPSGAVSRGAVPAVQRAAIVLRLSVMCDTQGGNMSSSSEGPLFNDLPNNPLNADIPVSTQVLGYAAGAAVVNLALLGAIGVVLHIVAAAHRYLKQHSLHSTLRAFLGVLPSSLLPGALAVPYGTLVQPGVGACVALLVSDARNAQTIVCGVAMLLLWMSFPIYCVTTILWCARRWGTSGAFLLRSVPLQREQRRTKRRAHIFSTMVRYVMRPRERWQPRTDDERRMPRHEEFHCQKEEVLFLRGNMEAVFGAYVRNREWFFAVEWGLSTVCGAVLGAAQAVAVDGEACSAVQWAAGCSIVFSAVHAALCVWLLPNSVRLELWSALLLDVLSIVSAALVLAGLDDASNAVANIAAVVQVVLIATVMCDAVVFRLQQQDEILDVMQPSSLRSPAKQRPMLVPQRLGDKKQSDHILSDLLSMSAPTSVSDQQKQLQRIVGLLCEKQQQRRDKIEAPLYFPADFPPSFID